MEIDHLETLEFYDKKGSFKGNYYKYGILGCIVKDCRKKKSNLSNVEGTLYTQPTSTLLSPSAINNSLG